MYNMKNNVKIAVIITGFMMTGIGHLQPAKAVNSITTCKSVSSVIKEDIRNVQAGRIAGRPYNNAGGHGGTRLPSIGRNQEYREFDADANSGRTQDRGKRRIVAVKTQGKNTYGPIYVTLDHYKTFCRA